MAKWLESHDVLIETSIVSFADGEIYPVLYSEDAFAIYLKADGSTHKVEFNGETS